jgi:hypothetical protein
MYGSGFCSAPVSPSILLVAGMDLADELVVVLLVELEIELDDDFEVELELELTSVVVLEFSVESLLPHADNVITANAPNNTVPKNLLTFIISPLFSYEYS